VGIDGSDDADVPSDGTADRADRSGDGRRWVDPAGAVQAETRSREEYHDDLRAAVAEARAEPQRAAEPEIGKPWEEVTAWSGRVWAEFKRTFPIEERPVNAEIAEECDNIAEREKNMFSPALREIESRDPDRHLVGFEHRLKGRDRIAEKVFEGIKENNRSPGEAVSIIPDAIRYTFQYDEGRYSQGVRDDVTRLKEQGFELVKPLKNSWPEEQYKGINSQWVDPDTSQRFEVQFHTRISFEAKQITHPAYERLRSGQASELERMVLKAFQREVSAEIPVPPGAEDISDYPERGRNAR
jgi:hypothetical protein